MEDFNELDLNFNFDDNGFEMLNFDLDEETRYEILQVKKRKTKNVEYKYAQDFAKQINIEKDSRYYAFIDGSFIFGDFIEAYLVGRDIKAKVTLSTLSLSQENIDSFANLLDKGYISELNIIVSDYFFAHERNLLIRYMYEVLDIDNMFQLAVCRTHTKITLIEHEDKKIVISGSANLRTSDNLEQVSIEENEELYNFNYTVHKNILNEYKTINKSIKSKKLWQVVQKKELEGAQEGLKDQQKAARDQAAPQNKVE
jgi:hypothetical protein